MSESLKTAQQAAETLMENKGEDVVILDVSDQFRLADYFVIATGQSRPHLDFLVKEIRNTLKEDLEREPSGPEGTPEQGWVLVDYRNVIIHLFTDERRDYYDLENLWADADVISA